MSRVKMNGFAALDIPVVFCFPVNKGRKPN
jgi:hypothetical protein